MKEQSIVEILAGSGSDTSFEKIRRLIGMGGDNLLPEATGDNSPIASTKGRDA